MSEARHSKRFQKRPAGLVTLAGVATMLVGVGVGRFTSWNGVYPSVFIEVGAGIALVALIVVFEDKIVRQQAAAVEERVEQRAEERQQELSKRIEEVASTVADLNARVEEARHARIAAQDEAVRAIQEKPTARTVARALKIANDLGAISPPIVVQASREPKGARITARNSLKPDMFSTSVDVNIRFPNQLVAIHPKRFIHPTGYFAEVVWHGNQSAEEFVLALEEALQRRGNYEPGLIDAEALFANLITTLDVAIQSRRGVGENVAKLRGSVIEMYSDEWFITSDGIECPSHGFLQPDDDSLLDDPPAPEFVSAEDWRFLVSLAANMFNIRPPGRKPTPGGMGSSND